MNDRTVQLKTKMDKEERGIEDLTCGSQGAGGYNWDLY